MESPPGDAALSARTRETITMGMKGSKVNMQETTRRMVRPTERTWAFFVV